MWAASILGSIVDRARGTGTGVYEVHSWEPLPDAAALRRLIVLDARKLALKRWVGAPADVKAAVEARRLRQRWRALEISALTWLGLLGVPMVIVAYVQTTRRRRRGRLATVFTYAAVLLLSALGGLTCLTTPPPLWPFTVPAPWFGLVWLATVVWVVVMRSIEPRATPGLPGPED